jgi:hypothetical protein
MNSPESSGPTVLHYYNFLCKDEAEKKETTFEAYSANFVRYMNAKLLWQSERYLFEPWNL